ncbi:Protein fam13b [Batrachochytrium dendrobatidis]|nr:Protein fam13b [Batrachochytrium dendrobatidis]KAK5665945.1 Protein fam13b [Batrachochytrium dendrobatidis]
MVMKRLFSRLNPPKTGQLNNASDSSMLSSSAVFGTSLSMCVENDAIRILQHPFTIQNQSDFLSTQDVHGNLVSSQSEQSVKHKATNSSSNLKSTTARPLIPNVPIILQQCIQCLDTEEGLSTQGLFRTAASSKDVKEVRKNLEHNLNIWAATKPEMDLNLIVSSIMKQWMRELTDRIIPREFFYDFSVAGDSIEQLKKVVSKLPTIHQSTLVYLCRFLVRLSSKSDVNKMTISNIAIVFGPTIFYCPSDSQASQSPVVHSSSPKTATPIAIERFMSESIEAANIITELLKHFEMWNTELPDSALPTIYNDGMEAVHDHKLHIQQSASVTSFSSCRSSPEPMEKEISSIQKQKVDNLVEESIDAVLFGISRKNQEAINSAKTYLELVPVQSPTHVKLSSNPRIDTTHVSPKNETVYQNELPTSAIYLEFKPKEIEKQDHPVSETEQTLSQIKHSHLTENDVFILNHKKREDYIYNLKSKPCGPNRHIPSDIYIENMQDDFKKAVDVQPGILSDSADQFINNYQPWKTSYDSVQKANSLVDCIHSNSQPIDLTNTKQSTVEPVLHIAISNKKVVDKQSFTDNTPVARAPLSQQAPSLPNSFHPVPVQNSPMQDTRSSPNGEKSIKIANVQLLHPVRSSSRTIAEPGFLNEKVLTPEISELARNMYSIPPNLSSRDDLTQVSKISTKKLLEPLERNNQQHTPLGTLSDTGSRPVLLSLESPNPAKRLIAREAAIVSPISPFTPAIRSASLAALPSPLATGIQYTPICPLPVSSGQIQSKDESFLTRQSSNSPELPLLARSRSIKTARNDFKISETVLKSTKNKYTNSNLEDEKSSAKILIPPTIHTKTPLDKHQLNTVFPSVNVIALPLTSTIQQAHSNVSSQQPMLCIEINGKQYSKADLKNIKDEYKMLQKRIYQTRTTNHTTTSNYDNDHNRYMQLKEIFRELQNKIKESAHGNVFSQTRLKTGDTDAETSPILLTPSITDPSKYSAKLALDLIMQQRRINNRPDEIDQMTMEQIRQEREFVKSELAKLKKHYSDHALNASSSTTTSSISKEERLIMKQLYLWYCNLKQKNGLENVSSLDTKLIDTATLDMQDQVWIQSNQKTVNCIFDEDMYQNLKKNKRELQIKLFEYQTMFQQQHGRHAQSIDDWEPLKVEYLQYKIIRKKIQEMSILKP